jgi:hypothetical protein
MRTRGLGEIVKSLSAVYRKVQFCEPWSEIHSHIALYTLSRANYVYVAVLALLSPKLLVHSSQGCVARRGLKASLRTQPLVRSRLNGGPGPASRRNVIERLVLCASA